MSLVAFFSNNYIYKTHEIIEKIHFFIWSHMKIALAINLHKYILLKSCHCCNFFHSRWFVNIKRPTYITVYICHIFALVFSNMSEWESFQLTIKLCIVLWSWSACVNKYIMLSKSRYLHSCCDSNSDKLRYHSPSLGGSHRSSLPVGPQTL